MKKKKEEKKEGEGRRKEKEGREKKKEEEEKEKEKEEKMEGGSQLSSVLFYRQIYSRDIIMTLLLKEKGRR